MKTLIDGPEDSRATFVFAHGAGAPMDSGFMRIVAEGLAAKGIRVVRFEFPYMAARRGPDLAKRGAPDRPPVLLSTFTAIARGEIERARDQKSRVFLGGKSMGGRIASMICDDVSADGLVCLGYPFWPPGKPKDDARLVHLRTMKTRALILQGTRDPFGGKEDLDSIAIAPRIHFIADGDHDMKPRKSSGRTHAQNFTEMIDVITAFIDDRAANREHEKRGESTS